jgi:NitT/TauT family transport system substrate-binding protein
MRISAARAAELSRSARHERSKTWRRAGRPATLDLVEGAASSKEVWEVPMKIHLSQWRGRATLIAAVMIAVCTLMTGEGAAQDTLKIAVGLRGNWDTAASELGQRAGIFKKHGLSLGLLYTQGAGETLQALVSGVADIGVAVGTGGVMAVYAKGAPVRVIGSAMTGTNDVYWFVRADSPLKSLRDATENTTIAYSSAGSSTNLFVLGLLRVYNIKAKPTRTGDTTATFTQVMSGAIDVGYAVPPFGLQALEEGRIRIIARASDIAETRDQTVRLLVVNAHKLSKDKEVIARYVQAYTEAIDWMYTDPKAIDYYRDFAGVPPNLTKKVMSEFYFKEMLDPYRISGLETLMSETVKVKMLQAPLTKEQLAELFQVPKR